MIIITINQNSDRVEIKKDSEEVISIHYGNYRNTKLLLTELLNAIADERNVRLTEINEDTEVTIDEW